MKLDRILVVEDDVSMRRMLASYLTLMDYTVVSASSIQEAREAFQSDSFELLMADLRLPDGNGLDLLREFKQVAPQSYGILITGYGTMETAVEGIRIGLFDYLIKPIQSAQLDLVLQRLEAICHLESENSYLRQQVQADDQGSGIIWGRKGLMQDVLEMVKKVAQSNVPVLISGESGTGKEVVAKAIVQESSRAQKPFIQINCASMSQLLLESELFGHERGAFPGATQRREGRFETANEGTLFMDEIAKVPLATQAKLLRILETGEFERLGGHKTIRVDVRVLASTSRDLYEAVRHGHFQEDLLYRLNIAPINLPPLRLRGAYLRELIDLFVEHFALKHGKTISGITPRSMERLCAYRWPGNIRELQNTLERAVITVGPDGPLDITEFALPEKGGFVALTASGTLPTADEMERKLIGYTLLQTNHNKTHAAEKLAISLRTLRNKLRAYRKAGFDTDRPEQWVE